MTGAAPVLEGYQISRLRSSVIESMSGHGGAASKFGQRTAGQREPRTRMDLLIKNVRVEPAARPVDIAIEGGKFSAIERGIRAEAETVIDAGGRAAVPGLLEPHLHLDKALLASRMPARSGTLEEAIRVTGILKRQQEREDVLDRSRTVLDMAVRAGTTAIRAQADVDVIQNLMGVETALLLREEYRDLLDLQVVAFPQEGILKSPGTRELMEEALRLGADVVGGCPYNELNAGGTKRHVDLVFEMGQKYGVPVDMHADFADGNDDERYTAARYIAERTAATGYQGRVTLGHVTSLAAFTPEAVTPIIDLLQETGVSIVTLPATDLYLGARNDPYNQRRCLAPVRRLRDGGVNVTYSSNNIRNAFTPFGKADPLQIGNFLAHLAQFGTPDDQAYVLRMDVQRGARDGN